MKSAVSSLVCGLAVIARVAADASPAKIEARATQSSSGGALPTVTTQGNAFFANGERFYIRGLDYQPGGSSDAKDPLADQAGCDRDIPVFQQLNLNTIRVYTVDNTANHDYCMSKLAAAGIYVAIDVNTPFYSLNRDDPAPSYNAEYLQSIFATMDAFAGYSNTLLFFSGNEVINDSNTTTTAPYIKAVTRDMKLYRTSRGMRAIPIGYSAADVSSNSYQTATYLNCGPSCQRSDFFAFNDYSWCDPATSYAGSVWQQKVQLYGNYSIPLFMSEYGCIKNTRDFTEVSVLYSTQMTPVYSGGLIYEYSEEGNGYGIVTINGDSVTPVVDNGVNQENALSNAFKNTPNPSGDGGYKQDGTASNCPTESNGDWNISPYSGTDLPAFPSGAVKYLQQGAGTGPGLTGQGSQNSGDGNVGTASPACNPTTAIYGTATTAAGAVSGTSTKKGSASVNTIGPVSYGPIFTIAGMMLSAVAGALLL